MQTRNFANDILFGVAVGDALGVPVEFKSRDILKQNPVTDMIGYGTHNQPPGTWSDDGSLTFCLAESLCQGYDLRDLADRFISWRDDNYWTPHGHVFDIGYATSDAISNLRMGAQPVFAGRNDEQSNGNGSLMRILPLVLYTQNQPIERRFKCTKEISSLTHAHIRSILACFIYLEFALQLLQGKEKFAAFENTQNLVNNFLSTNAIATQQEIDCFRRILGNPAGEHKIKPINEYPEHEIASSGYVLHSLEASFWCLLNSDSYEHTVLKAVNMGDDTDTTAAIVGGLAGLLYGQDNIPPHWVGQLARKDDITDLASRLHRQYV